MLPFQLQMTGNEEAEGTVHHSEICTAPSKCSISLPLRIALSTCSDTDSFKSSKFICMKHFTVLNTLASLFIFRSNTCIFLCGIINQYFQKINLNILLMLSSQNWELEAHISNLFPLPSIHMQTISRVCRGINGCGHMTCQGSRK